MIHLTVFIDYQEFNFAELYNLTHLQKLTLEGIMPPHPTLLIEGEVKMPPNLKCFEIHQQKVYSRHAVILLHALEGTNIEHISLRGTNIEENFLHVDLVRMLPKMKNIKTFLITDL